MDLVVSSCDRGVEATLRLVIIICMYIYNMYITIVFIYYLYIKSNQSVICWANSLLVHPRDFYVVSQAGLVNSPGILMDSEDLELLHLHSYGCVLRRLAGNALEMPWKWGLGWSEKSPVDPRTFPSACVSRPSRHIPLWIQWQQEDLQRWPEMNTSYNNNDFWPSL